MDTDQTGRAIVQDAMGILNAFFQGQSDAYWGLGPQNLYTSSRIAAAYMEGFNTYQNPAAVPTEAPSELERALASL